MNGRIHIRVLVIDDEEAVCRKLREWLTNAFYDAVTFTDPREALAHVSNLRLGAMARTDSGKLGNGVESARSLYYHLALVDLRLADADGSEVIALLRAGSPETCILAMTAFPEAVQVIAAVRAGARDLVEKPIYEERLLETVARHLADTGVVARDEHEFNRRLGSRLRSIRQAAERTLSEVAEAAGITQAQLSQIELGKTATSTWTLARLCAALRVPLGDAFDHK